MIGELNNTFFTQYGKYFSSQHIKKNATVPFKDHPHLSILVDTLSRKNNHHIILHPQFSSNLFFPFIEALLLELTHEFIPYSLQNAELIYFNVENLFLAEEEKSTIEKDFLNLKRMLDFADKNLLFAFTDDTIFLPKKNIDSFLQKQFEKLLTHPNCRYLAFSHTKSHRHEQHYLNKLFSHVIIAGPTEADIAAILKQQRGELENFHHVVIPEELLALAYSLSERYLSTTETLEKSLLLLDSSAARTSTAERIDHTNTQFKPVLTTTILTNVLSGWTQIPASHLQLNKFKLSDFTQGMHQRVFGQEAAMTMLGQAVQQSQAHLQYSSGPFCSLLFAGPEHSGKRTAALALAEQLFKQLHVLYVAQITTKQNSLLDIRLQRCTDKHYLPLIEVIQQTPYAMMMLENIDQASPLMLNELQEILSTGLLHDTRGTLLNFRQSIILLSTTLGTQRLTTLAKTISTEEDSEPVDLMQLIMNEQKHETYTTGNQYSPQEIADEIMSDIQDYFPASLHEHLHIIPFLPLNKSAVEQIIRLKFKLLSKMLDSRYGVELGYAPEVIRYLASEVLIKQDIDNQVVDIDKALKQLYFVIEQAILSQADNKNRPHQLFLQLNETGQLLRCDWLHMTARQHAT